MEQLLIIAAAAFLLLPLPLCIYLIVRSNRQETQLQVFAEQVKGLQRQLERTHAKTAPTSDTATETEKSTAFEATPEAPPPPQPFQQPATDPTPPPIQTLDVASDRKPAPRPTATQLAKPRSLASPKPRVLPFLRSIGLWPPEDLARRESGLIQWWFPRIGGLLAVLTVIFFAVYISRGSPPWVKWIRLMLVDAAVVGLGVYFVRKPTRKRFGSTILSVGLSMTYVSIVAGYAAAPVRVFENPLMGVAAQLACVVAIFATSLRLRDSNIGILASVFGYSSTVFSAYVGWNEGALLSAIMLQLAGMACGYRLKSPPLISLSSVGVYIPVAAFCAFKTIGSASYTLPDSLSVLVFLCLAVSALPIASLSSRLPAMLSPATWRLLQGANTTLCLATGYAYFRFFTLDLTLFYGTLCLLFTAWTVAFLKKGVRAFLFQLLFIKAAGLAALWAANYFHGDLRWFALIVDAVVVAFVARISASRWKEAVVFVLWIVAVYMAVGALPHAPLQAWSATWILYLLLPVLGVAGLSYLFPAMTGSSGRRLVYTLTALSNGLLFTWLLARSDIAADTIPLYLALAGALIVAIGFIPRFSLRAMATTGGVPIFASHITYWTDPYDWSTLAVVLGVSLAGAYACAPAARSETRRRHMLPEWLLLALSMVSAMAYIANGFSNAAWYPYVFPALAVLAFTLGRRPFRTLSDAALVPIALHIAIALGHQFSFTESSIALGLYGLLLIWPKIQPASARHPRLFRQGRVWLKFAHLLVATLALVFASQFRDWLQANLLVTITGFGFFVIWRLHRHRSALASALALMFIGLILTTYASVLGDAFSDELAPWAKDVLLMGILQAFGFVGCAIWLAKASSRRIRPRQKTFILYALASGSFAAIAISLSYEGMALDSYYTPLIATYCLALVILGIALKIKPLRMVAIVGFLLPISRLFAHDIRETLYRIIAFAALAILLTLIGYLYNRFSSRIE